MKKAHPALEILERRRSALDKAAPAQLEFWPEKFRGLPNTLARCALFTAAAKRADREQFVNHLVFSVRGFELTYSGEELRQDDQDVFLQLVHMTRATPLGSKLAVTGYAILDGLGWGDGGRQYDRLKESVLRLARSRVEIHGPGLDFVGGLLPSMTRVGERAKSRFELWLDPVMIKLFGENMYSMIDWTDRLKLSALAKWLHSFYFTNKEPVPYGVPTIHRLCGSKAKKPSDFKFQLKEALEELVEIGFLVSFDLSGNVATVKRRATNRLSS